MSCAGHFERLRQWVDLEREEEKARLAAAARGRTLDDRVALGFALADLVVADESSLAGRPLVAFARVGGGDLGGAGLRPGDLVRVTRRRGRAEEEPTGVVARRTFTAVAVAFDEPPPEWVGDGQVALELLANDLTYQRVVEGLSRFAEGATGRRAALRAILLGERPPGFRRRPDLAGIDRSLNPEQAGAVAHALAADDVALVHGPPGTGKTAVLAEVGRLAAAAGERVLAAAASNHAVDNLVERLVAAGLRVVRLGHPARVNEAVLAHTLEAQVASHERARIAQDLVTQALEAQRTARRRFERGRGSGLRGHGHRDRAKEARRESSRLFADARRLQDEAARDVLDRAQVICATATGLESAALPAAARARGFDLCLFDEATQATEPACLLAISRSARVVLAGDHRQLPPTVLSERAAREGLSRSLFERLLELHGDGLRRMLVVQHRMNDAIMRFASERMYEGRLRAHPRVATRTLAQLAGVRADPAWKPIEFLDTAGKGFDDEADAAGESRRNAGESELAAAEVRAMREAGVAAADIAVIAPYGAQAQLLRSRLGPDGPEVDTVDGFQGREKEAVVVSLTRSNPEGEIGFLTDVRRMNVAVTRARRRLVVIGDSATVGRHPFYADFIAEASRTGGHRSAWDT